MSDVSYTDHIWTAGAWITALQEAVAAQDSPGGYPTLGDEIKVSSAPLGSDDVPSEFIVIIDAITDEEAAALGTNRRTEETYVVSGVTYTQVVGTGEDAAVEARNRVMLLHAAVEQAVRSSADLGLNASGRLADGTQIHYAVMTRKDLKQGIADEYRMASVEWEVTVKARTNKQ